MLLISKTDFKTLYAGLINPSSTRKLLLNILPRSVYSSGLRRESILIRFDCTMACVTLPILPSSSIIMSFGHTLLLSALLFLKSLATSSFLIIFLQVQLFGFDSAVCHQKGFFVAANQYSPNNWVLSLILLTTSSLVISI